VHNGIEYGLMQLIAETYDLLHRGAGLSNAAIADIFHEWSYGPFGGFLTQITSDVLRVKDAETGQDLVDLVQDKAKQKGTGKWTSQDAMDLGIPIPTIDAAVSARQMSSLKEERIRAQQSIGRDVRGTEQSQEWLDHVRSALHLAFLISYAQGFSLLDAASTEHGMEIDLEGSAKVWRAGCIIRSKLLEPIREAYLHEKVVDNLLVAPAFQQIVFDGDGPLANLVIFAANVGIPTPCLSASLAYLDGYRSARLPANLIQAQRDFFGAHTYERTDQEGSFHTDWGIH
jgi:6-phosphogluconate dehydrogenase